MVKQLCFLDVLGLKLLSLSMNILEMRFGIEESVR